MNPILSVVVPIYNGEQKLDRCIQSILNQTYDNFELILIDDGSIDKTAAICDEYALKDKRIVVKHIHNSGVSSARNLGIDLSRGKYLMFIDSDDYLEKEMFRIYIQEIEKAHLDVVIGQLTVIDQEIKYINKFKRYGLIENDIWHDICLDSKPFGYVAGKLYSMKIIKMNNIRFNIKMKSQEDLDFALSVFKLCSIFNIIQYSGYYYDYSIPQRVVPYKDLINNQLKIFQISKKKISLSKNDIQKLSDRINSLIYGYLYSGNSYYEIKSIMDSLSDKNLFDFWNYSLCMDKNYYKLINNKQYFRVYLYFKIRKFLGRLKRKLWYE